MAVIVGYVPTKEGQAALARGVEEAKLRGMELIVVNSHRGGREFDAEDSRNVEAELDRIRAELAGSGVQHTVRELVRGNDPAEDLVEVAEETSADLIVIGLRRRSPVGKLVMGSNAQRILLSAGCAVLAVKAGA